MKVMFDRVAGRGCSVLRWRTSRCGRPSPRSSKAFCFPGGWDLQSNLIDAGSKDATVEGADLDAA